MKRLQFTTFQNYDSKYNLSRVAVGKCLLLLIVLLIIINNFVQGQNKDKENSQAYLSAPQVDDIYFLDFRLLSDNLRPTEKYRIAKVVDVTGDIVTLLYGNVFYLRQQSLKDSIRYGQLRYKQYFETKRYDLTLAQLQAMFDVSAIFMIKRPENNMLYSNYINDPKPVSSSTIHIPGKRENSQGLSLLKSTYLENATEQAFNYFLKSAKLGFAKGQINLGQMYLNGNFVKKDMTQALFWFNKAALQSSKAAVLKYVIVCRQLDDCREGDFYQSLTDAGVNIKVRSLDFTLD
jgi:hypothetical protein